MRRAQLEEPSWHTKLRDAEQLLAATGGARARKPEGQSLKEPIVANAARALAGDGRCDKERPDQDAPALSRPDGRLDERDRTA